MKLGGAFLNLVRGLTIILSAGDQDISTSDSGPVYNSVRTWSNRSPSIRSLAGFNFSLLHLGNHMSLWKA